MKKRLCVLTAALCLSAALAGCTADVPNHSADPRHTVSPAPTPTVRVDRNDGDEGGGAGGTNDVDNDGKPESRAEKRRYFQNHGGLDDQGRILPELRNDIGDAVHDAGDALERAGNAIKNP